jgi:hypothetical protein
MNRLLADIVRIQMVLFEMILGIICKPALLGGVISMLLSLIQRLMRPHSPLITITGMPGSVNVDSTPHTDIVLDHVDDKASNIPDLASIMPCALITIERELLTADRNAYTYNSIYGYRTAKAVRAGGRNALKDVHVEMASIMAHVIAATTAFFDLGYASGRSGNMANESTIKALELMRMPNTCSWYPYFHVGYIAGLSVHVKKHDAEIAAFIQRKAAVKKEVTYAGSEFIRGYTALTGTTDHSLPFEATRSSSSTHDTANIPRSVPGLNILLSEQIRLAELYATKEDARMAVLTTEVVASFTPPSESMTAYTSAAAAIALKQDRSVGDQDNDTCVLCLTNRRNIVVIPCGHIYACSECHAKCDRSCSICKAPVREAVTFYVC